MNQLIVGIDKQVELPKGGYLLLDDQVRDVRRARIFEPGEHCFNPLEGMNHRKARDVTTALYALYPQGENTLTVRNGKRALVQLLLKAKRLDELPKPKTPAEEEAVALVEDVLVSPVLRDVLCKPVNFAMSRDAKILAHIDRAELGDFDALALGLLLLGHFKGQLVVPDLGFYGRDAHISLIREERLIAGVNYLGELPEKLRNAALLIKDKVAEHCLHEDAETLAKFARHSPGTVGFSEFVSEALA